MARHIEAGSDQHPIAASAAVSSPVHTDGPESVLEFLTRHKKVTSLLGIAVCKADVPYHLYEDAHQEIKAAWSLLKVDKGFCFSQVMKYAYMAAWHAALKVRRAIGAVVCLPSGVVRDTEHAVMRGIGAYTVPLDIDDLEDSALLSYEMNPALPKVPARLLLAQFGTMQLSKGEREILKGLALEGWSVETTAWRLKVKEKRVLGTINKFVRGLAAARKSAARPLAA